MLFILDVFLHQLSIKSIAFFSRYIPFKNLNDAINSDSDQILMKIQAPILEIYQKPHRFQINIDICQIYGPNLSYLVCMPKYGHIVFC